MLADELTNEIHEGRWMTPDPLGGDISNPQSLNRYAYALNNPTTLTDPTGLDAGVSCSGSLPAGFTDPGSTFDYSCYAGGAYIAAVAMCAAFRGSPQIKFQGRASLYRTHGRLRHVCATRGLR